METETPKTPILEVAWTRYANLDLAADRRTKAFYDIRKWITILGVLATLFAIITQLFFVDLENPPAYLDFTGYAVVGLIFKGFFIAIPVVASIFAAFATKFYSNGAWLIYRAGGEEVKKEIYFYRTILQKDKNRRAYLEKRLAEIQRGLFRSLGGEFAFEGYSGPLPSNYRPGDPNSDPGFHDLTGEEYFNYRLVHQLDWHNRKVNQRKMERRWMTIYILAIGGLGSVLATLGGFFAIWVALTASIVAALIGWQELRNVDEVIKNYSKVVMELTILYDHWQNLEPEERIDAEFYSMVKECEKVLWAQNKEYIRSMQEALEESGLEKEASLIEGVIKQSVESAERTQQGMRDEALAFQQEALQTAEKQVVETYQTTLGSLAEEANSEVVRQELEAMGNAARELVETASQRFSTLSAQLAHLAREYGNVDIGRHTTKKELNEIMSRFPKSSEVKG
jgi:hypothetical protein